MDMSFPVFTIHLLGGVVFVLSAYVILKHVRDWRRNAFHLLPLHVWTISISYNFIVISLMWRGPENDTAFLFGSTGLLLGVYSLAMLIKYQRQRQYD